METWQIIAGVAFGLFALSVVAWKTAQYIRRGWKDHRWIWRDANRAAQSMAIIMAGLIGVNLLRFGYDYRFGITLCVALVFIAGPYIAYTTGRLLGIWHRSRQRGRLS